MLWKEWRTTLRFQLTCSHMLITHSMASVPWWPRAVKLLCHGEGSVMATQLTWENELGTRWSSPKRIRSWAVVLTNVALVSLQNLKSCYIMNERYLQIRVISQKDPILVPRHLKRFRAIDATFERHGEAQGLVDIFQFSCKGWWQFAFWKEVTDNPYLQERKYLQCIFIPLKFWCFKENESINK
jgi:hypothetical protein